jgi:hypothetical protein
MRVSDGDRTLVCCVEQDERGERCRNAAEAKSAFCGAHRGIVERAMPRVTDEDARRWIEACRAAGRMLRDLLQSPAGERAERIREHETRHPEWKPPTLSMLACAMLDVEVTSIQMPGDQLLAHLRGLDARSR